MMVYRFWNWRPLRTLFYFWFRIGWRQSL